MEWIERIKRKYRCRAHFDSSSFCTYGCLIAPVHTVFEDIPPNQEYDFYLRTKYDVYLLRIINSTEKTGEIYPAEKNGIIYIICCFPIRKDTLPVIIRTILHCLEPFGFPNLRNPRYGIKFRIKG